VVGDNLRDRVITISQPQIFQCAFERINQDSTVHCKVPIISVVDYKAEFASFNGPRRQCELSFYADVSELPVQQIGGPQGAFAKDTCGPTGPRRDMASAGTGRSATGLNQRERKACADPKGGGCFERVAGICAEREDEGCAGRAVCLFAMYRPPRHPAAAPNMVGQWPALRTVPRGTVPVSSRDDIPRPAK
jgi:hypothetical protein